MKIRIIKEVMMFEDELKVGQVYEATAEVDYGFMVDGMLVYARECEVVEE